MEEKRYTIEFTQEDLVYLEEIIEMAWSEGCPPSSSIWYQLENIKKSQRS